jgi:phospholipid transport system transporter-binding protein
MYQPGASLTFDNAKTALHAGLQAIAGGQKEIDFTQVTTVDSSAVAVALAWQRAARASTGPLVFRNLPENLRSLVALYDVENMIGIGNQHSGQPHH